MKPLLAFFLVLLYCNTPAKKENESSEWIQLFNGKDLKDWNVKITGYPTGDNFANTFKVENGVMKVSYEEYKQFR